MKNLSIENIISATGGIWGGGRQVPKEEITAVTTDSRTVTPGCLFAAIPGERVDGHDFAAAALAQGARCVLVQRVPEGLEGNLILVPDTTAALQTLAGFYRRQFDIPVVGVTGSVGKTTAKEMIASVLAQKYCVHKTEGNFNNDLGVPITLFGLKDTHQAAVVEMGVSHPGDMQRLAEMVRPTMGVYTVIGDAHLEFLGSRQGILAEKSVMNAYLPADGTVFCSGDDPLLAAMECRQETITFGLSPSCTLRAADVRSFPDGSTSCVVHGMGHELEIRIPAYGEHMIYAALAGAAVGIKLGLSEQEITTGIRDYQAVGHRARRLRTERMTVIDDCYNANPTSTAAAIRSLARAEGRKICILGDMLELGDASAQLHFDTGKLAYDCGIDLVLTLGTAAQEIAHGAGARGRHFETKKALLAVLPELIRTGDTVLVKASHSMRFEEITEALLKL